MRQASRFGPETLPESVLADPFLSVMVPAAIAVSELALAIYAAPFDVEFKGPNDPVTRADKEGNALIVDRLTRAFPDAGILAEESSNEDADEVHRQLARPLVFFVDPIDGTREFADKNHQFCVMIGATIDGVATVGVVAFPTTGEIAFGRLGLGAHVIGASSRPLAVSSRDDLSLLRAVVSRSHRSPLTQEIFDELGVSRFEPMGSVGWKVVTIARDLADAYVHPSRGAKLWDACAPEAIVTAAGGRMTDARGEPIAYRGGGASPLDLSTGLVATNGRVHDRITAVSKRFLDRRS